MKKIFLSLVILFTISFANVIACSCIGGTSLKGSLNNSEIVMCGKILKKRTLIIPNTSLPSLKRYLVEYTLLKHKVLKGELKRDTVKIVTGTGRGGDCGYTFEINKNYMVFGDISDSYFDTSEKVSAFVATNSCKANRIYLKEDLRRIKRLLKGNSQ